VQSPKLMHFPVRTAISDQILADAGGAWVTNS
jgi:hypothetical protein